MLKPVFSKPLSPLQRYSWFGEIHKYMEKMGLVVFNTNFNNISVISWRSVLLVEETGGLGENHQPVPVTTET
jgi:hypothetical protein